MSIDRRRVRAMVRKELRDLRRSRSLVWGMAITPVVFCVQPLLVVLLLASSAAGEIRREHVLVYLLGIPALVPSFIASYAVVGERQQGTLEPMLTTPVTREELLLGKALAALVPAVAVSYAVFAAFVATTIAFAHPGVAAAALQPGDVAAQVGFTPLLAGWTIWLALLVSTRATDVRVAQQLAAVASLPSVAVTTLVAVNVIPARPWVAALGAALLVVLNVAALRAVAAVFGRERLIGTAR